jgi:hypothetical protein
MSIYTASILHSLSKPETSKTRNTEIASTGKRATVSENEA